MTAQELIRKYLSFFKQHGHRVIPGSSLIPDNDPTALFVSAGMQPLVPYLMGQKHPAGQRLADVQKCLRTDDIEKVGDGFHHTFFLMLGNWSLGDYFKDEAISMSFEFLTAPDWLGIPPEKIYVSVFAGDEDAPRDEESLQIWRREFKRAGIEAEEGTRIFLFGRRENWWGPVGETGPCGPDTEMFFDTGKEPCSPGCNPSCSCGKYIEIWNDVFMEYNRRPDGKYEPLQQKNVDTGMGVARVSAALSGFGDDDYKTELFSPLIRRLEEISGERYGSSPEVTRGMRIVADHLRAATFAIADGVVPSNVDRGYIVRRLIRRAIRHGRLLGVDGKFVVEIASTILNGYQNLYPELEERRSMVIRELRAEEEQFGRTLARGLREFEKLVGSASHRCAPAGRGSLELTGDEVFDLYQTYGFPLELTEELARERGLTVDREGFYRAFRRHQEKSREGLEKKFAGGLADHSEIVTKYHTATHLLHAALRRVLGKHVQQKGSNITPERLRFDFSHPAKMTAEELKQVEDLVNEKIKDDLPVTMEEMSLEEARRRGALAFFGQKYGERVKVYSIGDFSKEVCGGPHVKSTGKLGRFEIVKEGSVGRGIRRIRAILHEQCIPTKMGSND